MSHSRDLSPSAPWRELTTTEEDWATADPGLLTGMLHELMLIRAFEELVLELAGEGLVNGPVHSSIGQEAAAVGSMVDLRADDAINGSHRAHHQFLAKAIGYVCDGLPDFRTGVPDRVRTVLIRTLAEICGLSRGYCSGRGGSMHLQWTEAGAMGTNAIVGGGVPAAAGMAWARRRAGAGAVALTYFGDGAVSIGSVLETMNLAAAWRLPLGFFIENNQYAVSTHVNEVTAEPRLSARGLGFNIPGWRVDGMDPLAVHLATREALAHMRAGGGPTIIEAEVYRYFHQNGPYPGSAFGYRSKDEEAQWRRRDPIDRLGDRLIDLRICDETEIEETRTRIRTTLADVAGELLETEIDSAQSRRRIRDAEWPSIDFVDVGSRGDLSELSAVTNWGHDHGEHAPIKFIDAVAAVMHRRMQTDPSVLVLGEDVHRLKGGTNGATKGLAEAFPDRVLGTPICENAFVGLAGGIAADGRYRPVVEFMYADFMWVAADQLFNQIGKVRHMFGGAEHVPLVLRTKVAMGTGYGSQHSMDPAGIFATAPGWRVVAPSTPADYIGLFNTALLCNDPVLVIEHVDLYQTTGPVPIGDLDFCLPVGLADLRRPGSVVTVLTYLSMTLRCLEAVEQTGVDAEVIDLRWLDRASLDWATIGKSIQKTNRVLIVEQGPSGTSYGGWLSDEIQRRYFDWLDHPVERVTGGVASPSISRVLEQAAIANTDRVAAKLLEMNPQI